MQRDQQEPIAIVGIGCRFPGANNPREFWELLREGRCAIQEVPANRWKVDSLYDADITQPGKMISRWGGFIEQVDQFDWRTFHMSPREARHIDPQQRLLLEIAWEALEDAGLTPATVAGSQTAVHVGLSWTDYLRLQSRNWSKLDGYTVIGNAPGFAASRISYFFDLKGPSMSIDAGCASVLASVQQACQSLWLGEATLALAGGVSLMLAPDSMIMLSKAGLLSPDGLCRALDSKANGSVRGEGAGLVVLKRLSQVQPSERVYALIRGIGINHNGHNDWLMGVSSTAQEALLRDLYKKSGLDPATVDYVELHGTGYSRGDAVEVNALGKILSVEAKRKHPCLIGSVKTNIGNLEAASGIASVIKVALALHHREIPATLHLQEVNPMIPFEELSLQPAREHTRWPEQKEAAPLAAVSTISITGTNAHVILEGISPSVKDNTAIEQEECLTPYLLPLSARSQKVLTAYIATFNEFLLSQEQSAPSSWRDVCYTASRLKTSEEYRVVLRAQSLKEARAALVAFLRGTSVPGLYAHKATGNQQQGLVFVCSSHNVAGQMIAETKLLEDEVFRQGIDECEEIFQRFSTQSIWKQLRSSMTSSQVITSPPVIFTLHIALARLWNSWGIVPNALLSDGQGEVSAAYLAGALSLEDALHILSLSSATEASAQVDDVPVVQQPTTPMYTAANGLFSHVHYPGITAWRERMQRQEISTGALDNLLMAGYDTFLELGASSDLSHTLLARQREQGSTGTLLASCQQRSGREQLLESLGRLYVLGYPINWSALYKNGERCVSLPPYPWDRVKLWPDWLDIDEISTPPERKVQLQPAHSEVGSD